MVVLAPPNVKSHRVGTHPKSKLPAAFSPSINTQRCSIVITYPPREVIAISLNWGGPFLFFVHFTSGSNCGFFIHYSACPLKRVKIGGDGRLINGYLVCNCNLFQLEGFQKGWRSLVCAKRIDNVLFRFYTLQVIMTARLKVSLFNSFIIFG